MLVVRPITEAKLAVDRVYQTKHVPGCGYDDILVYEKASLLELSIGRSPLELVV